MELKEFFCKCCTAPLDPGKAVGRVIRCEHCGTYFTMAKESEPKVQNFLNQAEHDLDTCNFEGAYAAYQKAAELDKEEPEAYFGMALAKFKVQYLKDETSDPPRLQPICHEISEKSFSADKHYLRALELASKEQKRVYREKASEIDEIRDQFNELKEDGVKYDCFLCVKVSDENGGTTQDSHEALRLYHHLKERGFHPFYSEEEIGSRTGSDYEALILYALYTSECMLLVCYNEEYLQTKWVKNEYTRFMAMIANEDKERDAITFVFKGKPIERLPGKSGKIQGIDLSRPDAYTRIDNFVESHTPEARAQREAEKSRKKREEEERSRQFEAMQQQLAESERRAKEEAERRRAEEEARNREREEMRAMIDELKRGNTPQQSAAPVGNLSPAQLLEMMRQAEEEEKRRKEEEERRKAEEERKRKDEEERIAAERRAYLAQFEIENGILTKYKGEGGDVVIPDGVTSIGDWAFDDCSGLTSITIPESVTSIGKGAFGGCSGLTRIDIPNGVASIGSGAFRGCNGLTRIDIPNGVASIGSGAFRGCNGLTSITIPDGVTEIGESAFYGCSGLTSIAISDGATSIGECAFYECSALAGIKIPNSVTEIGKFAFAGCSELARITVGSGNKVYHSEGDCLIETATNQLVLGCKNSRIPDGVTSIGEGAFAGCSEMTSLIIPAGVVSIGNEAFSYCSGLESITVAHGNKVYHSEGDCLIETATNQLVFGCKNSRIPGNITSIGKGAFNGCSGLTSITIPDGVISIANAAFWGCSGLERITVANRNKVYRSEENCLIELATNQLVLGCKNSRIPNGVTSIGDYAFHGCSGLTSVTIPDSVTSIGDYAFHGCSGLTSVTIPDSVTSIGEWAFSGCSGLTSVTIPDSVTQIGFLAFNDCTGLTQMEIAKSFKEQRDEIFGLYDSYKKIKFVYRPDPAETAALREKAEAERKKREAERLAAERQAFLAQFEIKNGVLKKYKGQGGKVVIPDGVTSIGGWAFSGCSGLMDIVMSDGVGAIGEWAFSSCSGLRSICFSANVASIGEHAFSGCSGLKSIKIPTKVTTIGKCAFSGCCGLSIVTIPNGVKKIGESAFDGCNELTSIVISNSLTAIENGVFSHCSRLASIDIHEGVTSIGDRAFSNCSGLKSITIPNSVTTIGKDAFGSCDGLKTVTIPKRFKGFMSAGLKNIFGEDYKNITFTFI